MQKVLFVTLVFALVFFAANTEAQHCLPPWGPPGLPSYPVYSDTKKAELKNQYGDQWELVNDYKVKFTHTWKVMCNQAVKYGLSATRCVEKMKTRYQAPIESKCGNNGACLIAEWKKLNLCDFTPSKYTTDMS
eukprot:TRINITY_DN629_c0_g2_i1.p1 TRINITY_DN629_c0_g2~~TRINITY_DN629_c0_g2_i1.p1  ORF type:complete len:149 (+),score=27.98 TRINITY_DN629_c0_g2_i1:50-448(+)